MPQKEVVNPDQYNLGKHWEPVPTCDVASGKRSCMTALPSTMCVVSPRVIYRARAVVHPYGSQFLKTPLGGMPIKTDEAWTLYTVILCRLVRHDHPNRYWLNTGGNIWIGFTIVYIFQIWHKKKKNLTNQGLVSSGWLCVTSHHRSHSILPLHLYIPDTAPRIPHRGKPQHIAIVETRRKGAIAKSQADIRSAVGLHNTQS